MVKFVATLLTFFIPLHGLRQFLRSRIVYGLYGLPVWRRARRVGRALHCYGPVRVTRQTELGDHVSFNGAVFFGGGSVTIGRWVHTGEGLKVFTRNHNYEGEAIPYDNTCVH